jgi:hypothetical protein
MSRVVVVVDIVGEGRAVLCQLMMHSPGSCVYDGRTLAAI